MKGLSLVLPPFAPDYGGAASALFELGGLIVIHDASGCTINYTSYDEPNWLYQSSYIYCSGLREIDAVLGDDEVLIQKILTTAERLKPAFIAILGSSVPMLIGTDFPGIAREVAARSGLPCFGLATTGLDYYDRGAEIAFTAILNHFCEPKTTTVINSVNLLGLFPMDYNQAESAEIIKRRFMSFGFEVLACLSAGSKLTDIGKASNAAVNVVLSSSGLKAARYLEKRFGIPFLAGVPIGKMQSKLLFQYLQDRMKGKVLNKPRVISGGKVLIIGETITSTALAQAMFIDYGIESTVASIYSSYPSLMPKGGLSLDSEEAIYKAINCRDFKVIIGDNLLEGLISKQKVKLIKMPSLPMSGGIFKKTNTMFTYAGLDRIVQETKEALTMLK